VPVLLSGVALPFYVGYFRGAVLLDSGLERTRGWVILVMGNFVMLALLSTDYTKQSWVLYAISFTGIAVAIFLGSKLAAVYPLAKTRRTNLAIAGGAATGLFFPIVAYLIASFADAVLVLPGSQLTTLYLVYLYLILTFASILIATERTCEVLVSDRLLIEYGGDKPNRVNRALRQLSQHLFFSPVDYLMIVVDPVYRIRKVFLCWFSSVVALALAGYSINWFHNNWLPVDSFVFLADAFMTVAIVLYLRIGEDMLLPPSDKL
jgi:hypothetical protein